MLPCAAVIISDRLVSSFANTGIIGNPDKTAPGRYEGTGNDEE